MISTNDIARAFTGKFWLDTHNEGERKVSVLTAMNLIPCISLSV